MPPFCIMTLSFHGLLRADKLTIADLARQLRDVGIQGLEPATSLFPDRPDLEAELPQVAGDLGLTMPCYDALANLVSPDPAARQAAHDSVRRDLERCHRWGIPRAMVAGSRRHADLSPADCRQQVAEGMNALQPLASAAGITLLVEPFGVELELHAASAHLREVMDQCDPAIGCTFDMGNFVLGGDRPVDLVAPWFDRVRHIHVKDFQRLPDGGTTGLPSRDGHRYGSCRLGEGAVQVDQVVRDFVQRGYAGVLSLEMSGADDVADVAADLAYLKRALA